MDAAGSKVPPGSQPLLARAPFSQLCGLCRCHAVVLEDKKIGSAILSATIGVVAFSRPSPFAPKPKPGLRPQELLMEGGHGF